MNTAILTRDVADRRRAIAAITLALAVLTIGALGVGAGLQTTMDDLTANMPATFAAFVPADVPGGYAVGEIFNLIAPATLVAYAVMAGASAVAGEEENGTMAILIAQPVARQQVMTAKALGVLSALLVPTVVFGAVALLASSWFDTGLTLAHVGATCLHLLALAAFFGAVSLAAAGATGNPGLAAMAAGGLAAIAYVSDAMLPLAGLDGWARISPWHYYASSTPLAHGIDVAHVLVLLALTFVATAAAFATFERRDLKG